MTALEIFFWLALVVVGYTYAGYGAVLYCLVRLRRARRPAAPRGGVSADLPEVALVVPAFNEADCIAAKIANARALDYPSDRLRLLIVTDGSTDGTPDIARRFPDVTVLHRGERLGKAAAINHAMSRVRSPVVVLSDANTLLNREALREVVRHYADPAVGGVAGEKRIRPRDGAASAGEGLYWRYESWLKRLDAELWTVVGAAGELLSFRRDLFTPLEEDAIQDDFLLSLRIAARGYRVVYEPRAYATEDASASVGEELKRRIRIAAGGWQSMLRLRSLWNARRHPVLTLQYLSHRVLRWSAVPFLLPLLLPVNALLAAGAPVYRALLWAQAAFYGLALAGYLGDRRGRRLRALVAPYYFVLANYAVLRGFARFLTRRQPATWERVRRVATVLLIALGAAPSLRAQTPAGSVHGRLTLGAVHFENLFEAPDGQPKETPWGQRAQGRLAAPLGPGGLAIYATGDAMRIPGFSPAFGAGVGLERTHDVVAFDASAAYLWNRPAAEIGSGLGPANLLRLDGEGSWRPIGAVQLIGRGEYRQERYPSLATRDGTAYEAGPMLRFRGFGHAFAPEGGMLFGRRDAGDANQAYRERTLVVGASSLTFGYRLYLSARYRRRVRTYTAPHPPATNFGRVDRRRQVSVTAALALGGGVSWVVYYARERGLSSRTGENFTTGFLSVGLAARF